MRVVVTGAAGLIGANLVRGLNAIGIDDIIAVDDLTRRRQVPQPARRADQRLLRQARVLRPLRARRVRPASTPCCTRAPAPTRWSTTAASCCDSNYRCSKDLLDACQAQGTRLLYASSAATYGGSDAFREEPAFERPLNVYGYSKLLFDHVVRRVLPTASDAGRGLSLLQRLRPARAAQGPHGVGRVPPLQRSLRATGKVTPVRRLRRLRPGRAGARLRLRRRRRRGQPVVPAAPRRQAASSTSAAAARSRSTTSRSRWSTRRARARGERGAAARRDGRQRALIEYIDFPPALVGKYQCFTAGRPGAPARRRLRPRVRRRGAAACAATPAALR